MTEPPPTATRAAPGARPSTPWSVVGSVGALTGLVAWLLLWWSADCEGMECLGTGLAALVAGVVVLPLVAVAGLALLHVVRPVRTGVLGCLASMSLVPAAMALEAALRSAEQRSVPLLPTVVVAAVVSGWAGLVVGSDRFETAQRWAGGLAVLLVFALTAAATA